MLRWKRREAVDAAQDDNEYSPIERLYAQWVVAHERGEAPPFEDFCAAHPDEAEDLRRRHQGDSRLDSLLRLAGLGSRANDALERAAAATARRELAELGPPTTRYELGARIGSGGMGVVHEARDVLLGRVVAYKRIRDPERAARLMPLFRREMRIAALLDHPGVATVHDAGIDAEGAAYYTMPLVGGQDLTEIYRLARTGDADWTTTRVVGLLLQVAETMAYVHTKGVVHRDLKPHNIRIGTFGEVRVMDWGLARVAEGRAGPTGSDQDVQAQQARDAEATGGFIGSMPGRGTPPYMAPEQWKDGGLIGPHSDVYALGAMLYELLAGRTPYFETDERQLAPLELVRRMEAGAPKPLRKLAPRQPVELVAICEQAMAHDPADRYADCVDLAHDLRAYLERRTVSAYETGAWAETKKFILRHRVLASTVVAAVVVTAALALYAANKAHEAGQEKQRALDAKKEALESSAAASLNLDLARRREDEASQLAAELQAQKRDLQLRGLILEVERLRAATRDTNQLANLGKPAYLWWIEAAQALVDGATAEDGHGRAAQPGLAAVRAKLEELRASTRVREWTPKERADDFATHPDRPRLEELRRSSTAAIDDARRERDRMEGEALWMERMLGESAWPARGSDEPDEETEAELVLLREAGAAELAALVLDWCGADGSQLHGREALAFLCAERAVARADQATRAASHAARAWALHRFGLPEQAWPDMELALADAPPGQRADIERWARLLREELERWAADRLDERRADLEELRQALREAQSRLADFEASAQARIEALEARCRERRTWRFGDAQDEWWHRQLSMLEHGLAELQAQLAIARVAAESPQARKRWAAAVEGIATEPKYAGIRWPSGQRLGKQLGLLPLGADPTTGLWEFVHLQTGAEPPLDDEGRPRRDAQGRLELAHDTGIIFVLLPSGTLPSSGSLGSERADRSAGVELAPFLLAKHEMTNAQWNRLAPRRKETMPEEDALKPAGNVSWNTIEESWARFLGWGSLPTSLQWEYACRAGTDTPWWTGADEGSLRDMENLALDDSSTSEMKRVGASGMNAFGLHDMQGNAWEWCADAPTEGGAARLADEPAGGADALARIVRGAGHADRPSQARSDRSTTFHPAQATPQLGWRAALRVVP